MADIFKNLESLSILLTKQGTLVADQYDSTMDHNEFDSNEMNNVFDFSNTSNDSVELLFWDEV